jgi:hypothetical protein
VWPVQLGTLLLVVGPVVQLDMSLSLGDCVAQLGSLLPVVLAIVQLGSPQFLFRLHKLTGVQLGSLLLVIAAVVAQLGI